MQTLADLVYEITRLNALEICGLIFILYLFSSYLKSVIGGVLERRKQKRDD